MSEALLTGNPTSSKRKRSEGPEETCILCKEVCSDQCTLKTVGWKGLQQKSELWIGLDTFGEVYETVDWSQSPNCYYLHEQCKIKLYSSRALDQARKRKENLDNQSTEEDKNVEKVELQLKSENLARSTRKSFDGVTHTKDRRIWCMQPEDKRHKDRKHTQLHLLNQV